MLLNEIFKKQDTFNNWVFPSQKTLEADFSEYKKKEERKWKGRAESMGMRFPLFDDFQTFVDSLKAAKVVDVTDNFANKVQYLTNTRSLDELRDMVSGYVRPRDVGRIVNGLQNNDPIPYPIILLGGQGMFIMAGNTRINAARILGITPKALLVDVRG